MPSGARRARHRFRRILCRRYCTALLPVGHPLMPDKFVWLVENGRPVPQLWPADGLGTANGRTIAAEHIIPAEEAKWPLVRLASKYPAPSAVGEVITPEMLS